MKVSGDRHREQSKLEHPLRLHERRRVARELHESTSQHLTALQLYLSQLRCRGIPQEDSLLDEMEDVLRQIQESISWATTGQSREDDRADEARARVARMFYSLRSSK